MEIQELTEQEMVEIEGGKGIKSALVQVPPPPPPCL